MTAISMTNQDLTIPRRSHPRQRTPSQPIWFTAVAALMIVAMALASLSTLLDRPAEQAAPPLAPYNPALAGIMTADSYGCDFTVPPLNAGRFPLANVTSVFVTETGELRLFCPSETSDSYFQKLAASYKDPSLGIPALPETRLIAQGARGYIQSSWPATIQVIYPETAEPTLDMRNLETGESLIHEYSFEDVTDPAFQLFSPPMITGKWWAIPEPGSLALTLVNIQTFEKTPMSELIDEELPVGTWAYPTTTSDHSLNAFLLVRSDFPDSENLAATAVTNKIFLIGDDIESARILELDLDRLATIVNLSPDGRYLAVASTTESHQVAYGVSITIMDSDTGEVIAESEESDQIDITEFAWSTDSGTFIYLKGDTVGVLEPGQSTEPRTIWQAELPLSQLRLTADPDRVAVDVGEGDVATTHTVTLSTGDNIALDGTSAGPLSEMVPGVVAVNGSGTVQASRAFLAVQLLSEDGTSVQLVDPLTGDIIATAKRGQPGYIANFQLTFGMVENNPVQVSLSPDGEVILLSLQGNDLGITRLEAVGEPNLAPGGVDVSEHGYVVVHFWQDDTRISYVAILEPTPTWMEVPSVRTVIHATPWDEASPQASTCDFSGQIPSFYANAFPAADSTMLRISSDNELFIRCPGEQERVIASGFDSLTATSAPETVMLTMWPEQDVRGQNAVSDPQTTLLHLPTGNTLQIAYPGSENNWFMQSPMMRVQDSTWLMTKLTANDPFPVIIDLHTLEVHVLSDVFVVDGSAINNGMASMSADGSATAVMLTLERGDEPSSQMILVLGESITDSHAVTIPDDLQPARAMSLSPDGTTLAVATTHGSTAQPVEETTAIALIDVRTGELIAQAEQNTEANVREFAWSNDSSRVVYLRANEIVGLPNSVDSNEEVLFQNDHLLENLRATRDDTIVLVDIRTPASDDVVSLHQVNLATGEASLVGAAMMTPHDFDGDPYAALILSTDGEALDPVTTTSLGDDSASDTENDANSQWFTYGELPYVINDANSGFWIIAEDEAGEPHASRLPDLEIGRATPHVGLDTSGRYVILIAVVQTDQPTAVGTVYVLNTHQQNPEWESLGEREYPNPMASPAATPAP